MDIFLRARYYFELPEFWFRLGQHSLSLQHEERWNVELRQLPSSDDEGTTGYGEDTKAIYWRSFNVSQSDYKILKKMWSEDSSTLLGIRSKTRVIIPKTTSSSSFPWVGTAFWDWMQACREKLDQECSRLLGLISWRCGMHCAPSYLESDLGLLSYSFDADKWQQIPIVTTVNYPSDTEKSILIDDLLPELVTLFDQEHEQPLWHQIFQEAWRQRYSQPRVSWVMSIVAAETATKVFIASHMPDTAWILENLQSPPILKIVREFIQTVPTKCQFDGKTKRPPNQIISSMSKGVEKRNLIVHGRRTSIERSELDSLLIDIRDYLWMIDYYSGQAWTKDYLTPEILAELETPTHDPN